MDPDEPALPPRANPRDGARRRYDEAGAALNVTWTMTLFYDQMHPLPPPRDSSLCLAPDVQEASSCKCILLGMYHSSPRRRPRTRTDENGFERRPAAQRAYEEIVPRQDGYLREMYPGPRVFPKLLRGLFLKPVSRPDGSFPSSSASAPAPCSRALAGRSTHDGAPLGEEEPTTRKTMSACF